MDTVYTVLGDWPDIDLEHAVDHLVEDDEIVTAYAENAASADLLYRLAITAPRDPAACVATVEALQADIRRFVETQCIEEVRTYLIDSLNEAA